MPAEIEDVVFTPLITGGFAGQLLFNVRDQGRDTAIAGVTPTVFLPEATNGPVTDSTGTSMFPLLNPGTYTLSLRKKGYKRGIVHVQLYSNILSYYVISLIPR